MCSSCRIITQVMLAGSPSWQTQ